MTFLGKIVPYLVYLGQGKDFKLTAELSWKSAICPQPGNKKRLKWSTPPPSRPAYLNKGGFIFIIKFRVFQVTKT